MTINEMLDTLLVCNKISEEEYKDIHRSVKIGLDLNANQRKSQLRILNESVQEYSTRKFINTLYTLKDIRNICSSDAEYDKYLLDIVALSEQYRKEGRYKSVIMDNFANNGQFIRLNKKKDLDLFKICTSLYKINVSIDGELYIPYSTDNNFDDSNIEYFTMMKCKFGSNIANVALLVMDKHFKAQIYTYPEIRTQENLAKVVRRELEKGCKLLMVDYIGDVMLAFV